MVSSNHFFFTEIAGGLQKRLWNILSVLQLRGSSFTGRTAAYIFYTDLDLFIYNKQVSASQFEAHAGWASRKKP